MWTATIATAIIGIPSALSNGDNQDPPCYNIINVHVHT